VVHFYSATNKISQRLAGTLLLCRSHPINAALVHSLSGSLRMFAIGTLCAAIAAGGTYLVQFFDAAALDSKHPKLWHGVTHFLNVLVIATVIYSYYRFWLGLDYAYIAFSN